MEYIENNQEIPKENLGDIPPLKPKYKRGEFEVEFSPKTTLKEMDDWMNERKIAEINRIIFWDNKVFVRFKSL